MNERTFSAATLHDAMQQAKTTLGPEAIILGTREVASKYGNKRVEVTARVETSQLAEQEPGELRDISATLNELRTLRSQWETNLASQERLRIQLTELVERMDSPQVMEVAPTPAPPVPPSMPVMSDAPTAHPAVAHLPKDVSRTLSVRAGRRARLEGREVTSADLMSEIAGSIPTIEPLWNREGRYVAAFVGPTGVGKTATIVKLAGIASFQHNKKVAIITTDGYRIGQVNTLKSYCDMLDIPLIEAQDRDKLKEAAKSLADMDLILIDTPGYNPWDEAAKRKVFETIHFADVEVHLVLSATARDEDIRDITASHAKNAIASVVITKLDEVRRASAILAATWSSGYGLSHYSDGREIPDALHSADPKGLANRILSRNRQLGASHVAPQPVPC